VEIKHIGFSGQCSFVSKGTEIPQRKGKRNCCGWQAISEAELYWSHIVIDIML
jgi:hypothetical protein